MQCGDLSVVMIYENGQLLFVTYWNTIKELEFGDMCACVAFPLSKTNQ